MNERRTKGRFSPAEIIAFLRRIDSGREPSIVNACAKIGISRTAYYYWRAKYGAQMNQEQRIERLEAELRALQAEFRQAQPRYSRSSLRRSREQPAVALVRY